MTKKRILNTTSRKKRDEMLPYFKNGSAASGASGPAAITGATGGLFLWCATARDLTTNTSGTLGTVAQAACRTSTTCYMRGLAENIEIQTATGIPWQWRRICFTIKGGLNLAAPFELETAYGEQRVLYNLQSGSTTDTTDRSTLYAFIFNGQYGIDWTEPLVAKLDQNRITVKYDKTTMISSGNASGKLVKKKFWMPMNSNLVYDDDETGENVASKKYSTQGKQGMGDYFVLDLLVSGIGGGSSDQLVFSPCSTLYWHER